MYDSYKKLRYKSKDDEEYTRLLKSRFSSLQELPLPAKNGKPIRVAVTEDINELLRRIESAYNRLKITENINCIANEAFATCTIEGARLTMDDTIRMVNEEQPVNKSEQMCLQKRIRSNIR